MEDKEKLKQIHPRQRLNETIKIPIWEIKYSYTTVRNNHKTHYKYLIADELEYTTVENEFYTWLYFFNKKHPERELSNVQILETNFLGNFELELSSN